MTIRDIVNRLAGAAIVLLCAVCAIELAVFFSARRATGVYRDGQQFPIPSGFQVNNAYLGPIADKCRVIRVTADGCPYCRVDRAQYRQLADEASRRGCQVIDVAPQAGAMAIRSESPAIQLQYVDLALGAALNPFLTPQTIVLSRAGRLAWQKQGPMGDTDVNRALRAVDGLSSVDQRRKP